MFRTFSFETTVASKSRLLQQLELDHHSKSPLAHIDYQEPSCMQLHYIPDGKVKTGLTG